MTIRPLDQLIELFVNRKDWGMSSDERRVLTDYLRYNPIPQRIPREPTWAERMAAEKRELIAEKFFSKGMEGMSQAEIKMFFDEFMENKPVPKKSVSIPEARQKILDAVMAQSTWVESDSLLAQRDMRERCANAAVEAFDKFVADLPIT